MIGLWLHFNFVHLVHLKSDLSLSSMLYWLCRKFFGIFTDLVRFARVFAKVQCNRSLIDAVSHVIVTPLLALLRRFFAECFLSRVFFEATPDRTYVLRLGLPFLLL